MQRDAEQERSAHGQALLDSGLLLAPPAKGGRPKDTPDAFHRKLLDWLVVDDDSQKDQRERDDPS
jgi:hypothetical protein